MHTQAIHTQAMYTQAMQQINSRHAVYIYGISNKQKYDLATKQNIWFMEECLGTI